ncbi:MAG: hypothetical protein GYA56_09475 [Geobacteraceae bacterium]|nr:hypothetical protein [Geobacteraceae bacterium]
MDEKELYKRKSDLLDRALKKAKEEIKADKASRRKQREEDRTAEEKKAQQDAAPVLG